MLPITAPTGLSGYPPCDPPREHSRERHKETLGPNIRGGGPERRSRGGDGGRPARASSPRSHGHGSGRSSASQSPDSSDPYGSRSGSSASGSRDGSHDGGRRGGGHGHGGHGHGGGHHRHERPRGITLPCSVPKYKRNGQIPIRLWLHQMVYHFALIDAPRRKLVQGLVAHFEQKHFDEVWPLRHYTYEAFNP